MNALNKFSSDVSFRALMLTVLLAASGAVSAQANWLEVRLEQKHNGKPLAGAAVCLGTSARPDQFGAVRSDAKGVVRFEDIRTSALLVTVSKDGFQGRQQQIDPLYQNRVLVLKMVTGGGGPGCDAAPVASAADTPSSVTIDTVRVRRDLDAGANSVLVSAQASGQANQIRISETADFAGARWQPLGRAVSYELSDGKGMKRLYVQVRRAAQVQGASIEVTSSVKRVDYRAN